MGYEDVSQAGGGWPKLFWGGASCGLQWATRIHHLIREPSATSRRDAARDAETLTLNPKMFQPEFVAYRGLARVSREGANREKLTVKRSSITRCCFFTVYVPYKP